MRIRTIAVLLTVAVAFGQNPAPSGFQPQAPSQDVTIRINVNLVQVDAVITDSKDRPVTNLEASDFEILQDGKPQVITNFGYITAGKPLPRAAQPVAQPKPKKGEPAAPAPPPAKLRMDQVRRTVAIVVDDLGLSFESTARVRQSLKKFVDEQMQPGDLVAIIRTAAGIGALQQFTTDKRMLYAAIERVKFYPFGRTSIGTFARMGDDVDSGTRFDEFRETQFAVGTLGAVNFVVNGLKEIPGRKSILLFSENMRMFNSEGSNVEVMDRMRRLTDAANRASVVIYSIDPRGLQTLSLTAADNTSEMSAEQLSQATSKLSQANWDSQEGMSFLAQETGGLFIHDNNDITGGVKKVMADQEGYYLIGYHPDAKTFDEATGKPKFHTVRVRVKKAGLRVRSRNGFFGVSDSEKRPAAGRSRDAQLAHALASPFGASGVELHLTTLFAHTKPPKKMPDPPKITPNMRKAVADAKMDAWRMQVATLKTGLAINSLLHIAARDLTFTKTEVTTKEGKVEKDWRKAVIDVLVATYGDNGQEVDRRDSTFTLRVKGEAYENALKEGLIHMVQHRIRKPGAYQCRVALRDATSGRIGAASQFLEVPDVGKGRLSLSGIVLRGDPRADAAKATAAAAGAAAGAGTPDQPEGQVDTPDPKSGPALRIFKQGLPIAYGYQVLNARAEKNSVQLEVQTKLFRDGQQVYVGKPMPFAADGQPDLKHIMAGGRMQLGAKMTAGDYVLQVVVRDRQAKNPKYSAASQWQTFEVVPAAGAAATPAKP